MSSTWRTPPPTVDVAVLVAGGDVEEAEFVGPGGVVDAGLLHRIAGIAQVDEVDALDHPPVLHVEAGDDAGFQHVTAPRRCTRVSALFASTRPS
jgi:hypothetical protein